MVAGVTMNLKETYIYLLKSAALSNNCGSSNVVISNIDPKMERIPAIEPLSYILIDDKFKSIFSSYYEPYLNLIRQGKVVKLPGKACVESVKFDGSLDISFRRARLFPTTYIDFLAIEKLAEDLGAKELNLHFSRMSNNLVAPYFKAVLDILGIKEVSSSCIKTIEDKTRMYYDIVELKYIPRMGHFLKLAAFYFAHVKRIISRQEARMLYYYLRYKNSLDSKPLKGEEYGESVYHKIISSIRSNNS